MPKQNTSSLIDSIVKSRNILLDLMSRQGYDVSLYNDFSTTTINTKYQCGQLDMLLETINEDPTIKKTRKVYIKYFLDKTLRPQTLEEFISEYFSVQEILTPDDTLYIVYKQDINENLKKELIRIWEKYGIFVIIQSLARLQFNPLNSVLVPPHRTLSKIELDTIKDTMKIPDESVFPKISRFDPIAIAIGLRPRQCCEVLRPSETAIVTSFYRYCANESNY